MEIRDLDAMWTGNLKTAQKLLAAGEKGWDEAWNRHLGRMEAGCKGAFDLVRSATETAREGRQTIRTAFENAFESFRTHYAPGAAAAEK